MYMINLRIINQLHVQVTNNRSFQWMRNRPGTLSDVLKIGQRLEYEIAGARVIVFKPVSETHVPHYMCGTISRVRFFAPTKFRLYEICLSGCETAKFRLT